MRRADGSDLGLGVKMTRDEFMERLRKIDPRSEMMESGLGHIIIFVEPNKLAEIAVMVFRIRPPGIWIEYLIHPDYIPEPNLIRIEVMNGM